MTGLKEFLKVFFKKIGLLIFLFLFLYLDSTELEKTTNHGLLILNILSIIAFVILFRKSTSKIKQLLIFYCISSFLIEYFFSIYLQVYTYRNKTIPIYVLIGHAIIYERVYTFSKSNIVKIYKKCIHFISILLILLLTIFSVYYKNDYFGLLFSIIFFGLVIFFKNGRTYFVTSFLVIVILEFLGVYFNCWKWSSKGFGYFEFLKSANPPIGIPSAYFLISLLAYIIYFSVNVKVWKRFNS